MAGKGLPPQPTALAKQKGYYRPSRHGELSVPGLKFLSAKYVPMPPEGLSKIASQHWSERVSCAIKIKGYISEQDLPVLTRLCKAWDMLHVLEKELDQSGMYSIDKNGRMVRHPAMADLISYEKIYKDLCGAFGFTPSSRTGIRLENIEEEKFDKYKL